jgi:flagellar biosynthesis/type III secretory pathway protein FliH
LVGIGIDVAEVILGNEPEIDRATAAQRVAAALMEIDDRPLTLFVHPDDATILGDPLAERFGLDIAEDAGLRPGEARIAGPWAKADFTRDAALQALRQAIS